MKLIQTLNEAANIPIDQLKAVMQKDPRVKKVFARSLELDEIPDKAEFITTLKYYITNNQHVREYLKRRGNARDLSEWAFKSLAKQKPEDLKEYSLDVIRGMVKDLFTDLRYVQKTDLSKRAVEDIYDLINARWDKKVNLNPYTVRELQSLSVHPKKSMLLYRGIAFDRNDLRDVTDYGGTMGAGEGLRFLKQVREGSRIIDINTDQLTLWTHDKALAKRIALYGRESSWRTEDADKIESRDELAFIISTLAKPEQIVVDLNTLGEVTGMPSEQQMARSMVVLKEGEYSARIVHRFDRSGELKPEGEPEDAVDQLSDLHAAFTLFNKLLKPPVPDFNFVAINAWNMRTEEAQDFVHSMLDDKVQERLLKGIRNVMAFYEKYIKDLDQNTINKGAGSKYSNVLNSITRLNSLFKGSIGHDDFRSRDNKWGSVTRSKATPEQQMTARVDTSVADLIFAVLGKNKRLTDRHNAQELQLMSSSLGGPSADKLHTRAAAKQREIAEAALDLFYEKLAREPKPETVEEQTTRMKKMMKKMINGAKAAEFLWEIKKSLAGLGE